MSKEYHYSHQDIEAHAIDYAMDIDRKYFEDHPNEMQYLRPIIEHEFAPMILPDGVAVLVQQVGPGVRTRTPVELGEPT